MIQEQHEPMGWWEIVRRRQYSVGVARLKLMFTSRLESLEPCPMEGCEYYICGPCPACGRHMAHGPYIRGVTSLCRMGSCTEK